ncbi:MAG: CAP domain-containing protein [Polyangiaceae bacterium]
MVRPTLVAIAIAAIFTANDVSADNAAMPQIDYDAKLRDRCGSADGGLDRVARALVLRRMQHLPAIDQGALVDLLRDHGAPYVWPRAWVATAHDTTALDLAFGTWSKAERAIGVRRCGVVRSKDATGATFIAAVEADALADLSPLPIHAHVGTWLTLDSRLLVAASDARAVLIEPGGSTRRLLSSYDGGEVLARFTPDRAGVFTVQVVADVDGGPRPVLEARVIADVPPAAIPSSDAVPGEKECGEQNGEAAFACILQSIRSQNRLELLTHDARLDALARAHAHAMMASNDLAHDAGDGDPTRRFEEAGIVTKIVGENVAHAESLVGAVRSLYASPSHRDNMLSPELDRFGVAVLVAPDGSVWVVEELAADSR